MLSVVNQQATAVEDGAATSFTLPEKPLRLVTVTIVCLSEPRGIAMEVALSLIEKSPCPAVVTVNGMVIMWDMDPLVAATTIV